MLHPASLPREGEKTLKTQKKNKVIIAYLDNKLHQEQTGQWQMAPIKRSLSWLLGNQLWSEGLGGTQAAGCLQGGVELVASHLARDMRQNAL
jgi:hypothetical protein